MGPILLAASILIPLFFLLVERSKRKSISMKPPLLPSSPPGLPFIGNLHQVGVLPQRSFFDLSKKYGPLIILHLGNLPTLLVSSPSYAQEILKTHDLIFASRPSIKASRILLKDIDMAFAPYGEYWRQIRKVCVTNLLSLKMIKSFSLVRMEEVSFMIKEISLRASTFNGVVSMSEMLNSLTSNVLCKSVLGSSMSEEKRKLLHELIRKNVVFFVEFFFEDYFPYLRWLDVLFGMEDKLRRHSKKWDILLGEFIEDHVCRLREGDSTTNIDFIDVMLQLQKDSSMPFDLTNEHIKAILTDMIAAGTDTSFSVLEWAMTELIRNPRVMEKVQNEVRGIAHGKEIVEEEHMDKLIYMKAVIKEVLRLHPPAPLLLPRESLQECQIQEYNIPMKTRVLINAWAIGRDETYWKEPQEFKPERFLSGDVDYNGNDFHYIPFGAGRRICPGMRFAIATIELALANLLHCFNWKLPSGISCDSMDMEYGVGITATRRQKLELVPLVVQIT